MKKYDLVFPLLIVIFTISFFLFSYSSKNENSERVKAKVLEVNNSEIYQHGVIKTGLQEVKMEIISGKNRGLKIWGTNQLMGKLELDKLFNKGDIVLAVLEFDKNGKIFTATPIDYYRISGEIKLLLFFIFVLIIFSGYIGIKALISFLFSVFVIWKFLIPTILAGKNPIFAVSITVLILSFVIIFLIGGFSKKSLVAFLGNSAGLFFTLLLSLFFKKYFYINGAIKPFSETLLYNGYSYLNLSKLFLSTVMLSAAGAAMDVAMDVATACEEIKRKKPEILPFELIGSGFFIGKAVIGTMTTTLLFAYSGSFITLLMVFFAQKIPVINILNMSYVSSEVFTTLVGSIGLVLVAPFTAIVSGIIFEEKEKFDFIKKDVEFFVFLFLGFFKKSLKEVFYFDF